jgi:phage terminase large subunit-like protein
VAVRVLGLPHQLPPEGDWRTWVILGGRGAGKTRAGPNGCARRSKGRARDPGRSRRVALVGETLDQAREVMVFGESGILACSPPDRRRMGGGAAAAGLAERGGGAGVFGA